ncbi:MAG: hypothetical protein V4478_03235 [Patescibacteria group bacterium]
MKYYSNKPKTRIIVLFDDGLLEHYHSIAAKDMPSFDVLSTQFVKMPQDKPRIPSSPREGTNTEIVIRAALLGKLSNEIHQETGVPITSVYTIMSNARKAGLIPKDLPASVESEETIAEALKEEMVIDRIRELWVDTDMDTREVCEELGISLAYFNSLIVENNICKTISQL